MAVPVPPPEARPEPPSGKKYPCERCGASLTFDPSAASLQCAYCGHLQPIPQSEGAVRELGFEAYFNEGQVATEVLQGIVAEVNCPSCAAIVEFPASIQTTNCPFCGWSIQGKGLPPGGMMAPQGLLPFSLGEREAREAFTKWAASRWFAPNDFQKMAVLGRLQGIYVPYWTYDAMTFSFYTGLRGDAYYVTVRDSKGNSRQERRVRWTPVSGSVRQWFDDVLVCASKGLAGHHQQALEPWDLPQVVSYEPAFLAGFTTERYQVSVREGFDVAKVRMDDAIRRLIERDIGGDHQKILTVRTEYSAITFKHLLLPVWVAAFRYYNRPFRVLINARSGEVQGERPYSWIKITLAVLGVILLVVVLWILFGDHVEASNAASFDMEGLRQAVGARP